MALFFGINIGLSKADESEELNGEKALKKPSHVMRWLFRKRQARFG